MKIVIDIDEKDYKDFRLQAVMLNPAEPSQRAKLAIVNGTPLPKGHGRLIDADAFIDRLIDASKRQRYNECLINEFLTVDDVFQAVIESLENKGLASGDAPTIIDADKEDADE